ncbi:choline BCCT transporter BetT [Poseidonibacter lekithochrous]|uniref:BCCT family transporter n=1 Tax=Poseidonibacter TaxID=2321187 RepID=UPI001C098390|nr:MULTISPECIES: choline BCCT transporter BetT [Poseidonibacter]MBU3015158.1 choline BCCT transporter BetT [Poseidonibacter lekithochrous]MDO6828455.1 choline BCCT transporter BetT [Poseidonibacter sp. 1_MG-2023]
MNNNFKTTILKPVFIPSVLFIILLVVFTAISPELANNIFNTVKSFVAEKFGWLYMLSVGIFVLFVLFLAISPFGKFKLGPDHSKPTYSNLSWFAMLFSAGMGIGLMFWGVAEPVMQYVSPPVGSKESIESAKLAMNIVFFHWGIHAWSIYALVGLVLAYFSFRHGLPLSIRSALYPLIGEKIYGGIGHTVDTIAVLGTVFGVATSLGFGVLQVNSGLNYLFDIPVDIITQIILISVITALATISVVLGLDGGIKRLSEINLYLASFLLLFVFIAGPTFFLLGAYVQNIGAYLSNIVEMTFNQYIYDKTSWMSSWTLFYWAWWIAWAPFVGMFIARVSRGRTIREFVIGVLFVPAGFTFLWMTVFGNSALDAIMNDGFVMLTSAVSADVSTALFKFLEHFPFSGFTSIIAIILVITFFITSADSGALVVDTIASGGNDKNPVWQRIFWAVTQGIVAIALLIAGGLGALQSASIIIAIPFAIVMLIAAWGLYRALKLETIRNESLKHHMNAGRHGKISGSWKVRLNRIIEFPNKDEVERFINEDVTFAMEAVKEELSSYSWNAEIKNDKEKAISILRVEHSEDFDFIYEVRTKNYDTPSYAYPESINPTKEQKRYSRVEVYLQDGNKAYDIYGYDHNAIVIDIIDQFEKHRHFLHNTSTLNPVVPID